LKDIEDLMNESKTYCWIGNPNIKDFSCCQVDLLHFQMKSPKELDKLILKFTCNNKDPNCQNPSEKE
jgi:hypothetical protein